MMKQQRRRFILGLGGLGALTLLPAAMRAATPGKPSKGSFMHVVFFWLKDKEPATREAFEKELRPFIENVKEIRQWHIGTPADTDREVIDNTWDYSIVLEFDSKKEHDIYQDHELHKQFVRNASALWTKVQVYDSQSL
jgi:hypothetical protein